MPNYTTNYDLIKPLANENYNVKDQNDNMDIIDQTLKAVDDKANNAPADSVDDTAIGTRTPDQTQAPASPGTGTLTQLVGWLTNRIRAITGKTNWWDAPPTTLQAAKNHHDALAPHTGHETPAGAQAKATAAETNAKGYTDTHANATTVHSATAAATANRIILRDASGRAKVAAPQASDDIARKAEVDAVATAAGAGVDAVQTEVAAHKAETMPHRFVDGAKTYRWGLAVIEGVVNMVYEEVV